jgi:hypothetical protein
MWACFHIHYKDQTNTLLIKNMTLEQQLKSYVKVSCVVLAIHVNDNTFLIGTGESKEPYVTLPSLLLSLNIFGS